MEGEEATVSRENALNKKQEVDGTSTLSPPAGKDEKSADEKGHEAAVRAKARVVIEALAPVLKELDDDPSP
mgnify:CR=1 FL=1